MDARAAVLVLLAGLGVAVVAAARHVARGEAGSEARASQRRIRFLELMRSLPRLEAEERAWPRPATLECQEKGRARAAEIEGIRRELAEVAGDWLTGPAALEACLELEKCAACDRAEDVAHCARARELLVEAQGDLERVEGH